MSIAIETVEPVTAEAPSLGLPNAKRAALAEALAQQAQLVQQLRNPYGTALIGEEPAHV